VAAGLLTTEQLTRALAEQTRTSERLGAVLVRLDLLSEAQLAEFLSRVYGIPAAEIPETIPPELLRLIPARIAKKYDLLPIARAETVLTLAMADPTNLPALDDVTFLTGLRVVPAIAPLSAIRRAIERAYGAPEAAVDALTDADWEAADIEVLDEGDSGPVDTLELRASADQAPVVRLVNAILLDAIRRRASDIHLESSERALRIRYRIDGILRDVRLLPRRLEPAVVSRIKIMAALDIAERRLPQDGRIKLRYNGLEVDLRVNVLPTVFGEGVSIRILDRQAVSLDLGQLGFDGWSLDQFRKAIDSPHGMIVITGPTGSGKTTTLYSAIQAINSPDIKIVTVEDPVEYNLDGINQVSVNEEIGRGFAAVLRSFLRHDPDVILVGEMRDLETAQIAIRAGLTGHLVLTTLHTNDAPSTVVRLLDMGIPPFLVASSLRLVVAQRLVRKLCMTCREPYEADEESLVPYGHIPQGLGRCRLYRARGCPACDFTGLRGRMALFETMPVSAEIRDLIQRSAATAEIRDVARQQGMKTLREVGLLKVLVGLTTPDEVLRVTAE